MTNSLLVNLRRGDVILCRVPLPSTLLQQFKLRPAVIVSSNEINHILNDILIVPCTSNTNCPLTLRQYLITGKEIERVGIKVESIVKCESIFTLNKLMVMRRLGGLSVEAMKKIDSWLRLALNI